MSDLSDKAASDLGRASAKLRATLLGLSSQPVISDLIAGDDYLRWTAAVDTFEPHCVSSPVTPVEPVVPTRRPAKTVDLADLEETPRRDYADVEIEERLVQIIRRQLGHGVATPPITPSTTFDDLTMDSLDAVEFLLEVEDQFDISIQDKDSDAAKSLGDFVRIVQYGLAHRRTKT